MKKMLLVYNPRSGKGLIKNHLSAIIELFSADGYEVTVHPTMAEKDATAIVSQKSAEYDLIVCSGGDGTLDEVVTGLMSVKSDSVLGYIPAGSTNDFGNSLGIPKQMEKAAETIIKGTPFSCDIGQINGEYFVYVAAFGYMTDVSYQTNQEMKNVLGHTAYLLEGIRRVGTWKSYHLKITSEEFTDEGDYMYGMISNATSVGGIKGITGKHVDLNDGLFEVMLIRTPTDFVEWPEMIGDLVIQNEDSPHVIRFKTKQLIITSEEEVAWTRDGEDGGVHKIAAITNLSHRLRIMV